LTLLGGRGEIRCIQKGNKRIRIEELILLRLKPSEVGLKPSQTWKQELINKRNDTKTIPSTLW
jgi:hypothetical protein